MAKFAAYTKVSVEQTRTEIERTLTRYGAKAFAYMTESGRAIIAFEANERHVKIRVSLPIGDGVTDQRERRERWRALLLVIKAKLASVDSGIETFEEAFYPNIVLPNGLTVFEATRDGVALAYTSGQVTKLLPDYTVKGRPQ